MRYPTVNGLVSTAICSGVSTLVLAQRTTGICLSVTGAALGPSLRRIGCRRRACVEYFRTGVNSWRSGILGLWPRRRTTLLIAFATAVGSITPLLLRLLGIGSQRFLNLEVSSLLAPLALLTGVVVLLAQRIARRRTIHSSRVAFHLHKLVESSRNLGSEASCSQPSLSAAAEALCVVIRRLFCELTTDDTVECAIRAAQVDRTVGDGASPIVYSTIARSPGLSKERAATSQPLPANRGVAGFFLGMDDPRGVLIFNDLRTASQLGAYEWSRNDDLFPDAVATMAAAPLNAWFDGRRHMVGILHITSAKRCAFDASHVDYVCLAADAAASALVQVAELSHNLASTRHEEDE